MLFPSETALVVVHFKLYAVMCSYQSSKSSFGGNRNAQSPSRGLSDVNLIKVECLARQMRKGTLVAVLTESDCHSCGEVEVVTQEKLSVLIVATIASHPL